jgi:protease I
MKKLAIIIAFHGFRDEEFFLPYNYLSSYFDLHVFSSEKGEAKGKLGGVFIVQNIIEELLPNQFDGLVMIGGPGGYKYLGDESLKNIIIQFDLDRKLLSAICMAPLILAEAGVLKGKNATVFSGEKEKIENYGVIYTDNDVEQDGNIITADGPNSSEKFAHKIKEYFNG